MLTTEVLKAQPARFDMVGQKLLTGLDTLPEQISQGLAKRLVAHAEKRLKACGFGEITAGKQVRVYTVDGHLSPAERNYCVRWTAEQGGYVEVVGIYTSKGWPLGDFGFYMGTD